MVDAAIEHELYTFLGQLPVEQQRQVLEFARALAVPSRLGIPGSSLLQFTGMIGDSDLEAMSQAIRDGCERIDVDEW